MQTWCLPFQIPTFPNHPLLGLLRHNVPQRHAALANLVISQTTTRGHMSRKHKHRSFYGKLANPWSVGWHRATEHWLSGQHCKNESNISMITLLYGSKYSVYLLWEEIHPGKRHIPEGSCEIWFNALTLDLRFLLSFIMILILIKAGE